MVKSRSKLRKGNRKDSAFRSSLYRHGDPANFALHVVALPFFILGFLLHRIDLLVMAAFFVLSGSAYAYFGAEQMKEIWVTLFDNNVNKWFTFLAILLFAIGLWSYDFVALLFGLTIFLFGLLYAVLTEY